MKNSLTQYIVLIRGINVGGKNKVSMQQLREHLIEAGYATVISYINSGNILLQSYKKSHEVKKEIESLLPRKFTLDSELIKVHILTLDELEAVILNKPRDFGEDPKKYYSDAIFLIDIPEDDAFKVFSPREGVDRVWKGSGVIYSERLAAERTKSRLNKVIASPLYKSMTIRSWQTTLKLLEMGRNK